MANSDDMMQRHMYEAGRMSVQNPMKPMPRLTVAEVIELAKAGVKIELEDVDLAPKPPRDFWDNDNHHYLMVALMQRVNQAFPLDMVGMRGKFNHMSLARIRGNKIGVMVVTANGNAALIEDDEKMFPSDTFIASLILMIETEEKSNASGTDAAPAGAQARGYASAGRSPTYAPPQSPPNPARLGGQRPPNTP